MELLDNPIQEYAWGSRTVLARFLGRPAPTDAPQAELWIGAHPAAPSRVVSGSSLDAVIAADPEAALGPSLALFGPRLPFLMKVLAVAEPLSLQVHPDRDQAERGFAADTAPPGDPARNYKDDWPKPEILCALTDFHALYGWRDPAESAEALAGVPSLAPVVSLLRSGDLRSAVETILTWPTPKETVAETAAVVPDPYRTLAAKYPGDMGVVVAVLLNEVRLLPGQALYVPPRRPHAYLSGTGVELMAGSDNVLRAGLTPKHVDVPELLSVVDFMPCRPEPLEPEDHQDEKLYVTPAPEFRLSRVEVTEYSVLSAYGPQLLLCTEGTVRVHRSGEAHDLRQGAALFAEHEGGAIQVEGKGTIYRAYLPAA